LPLALSVHSPAPHSQKSVVMVLAASSAVDVPH
jgi:hypothetical protein